MAIQAIKNGGFVAEEIAKINANFTEVNNTATTAQNTANTANTTAEAAQTAAGNAQTKANEAQSSANAAQSTATNAQSAAEAAQSAAEAAQAAIPTKTSELTNDSNFVNTDAMNAALNGKVDKVEGKGLSTNDYTTAEKEKLAGLSAPTIITISSSAWTASGNNKTFTSAANNKKPIAVMRKNGSNYGLALVDIALNGTNVVVTASEAFDGYIVAV